MQDQELAGQLSWTPAYPDECYQWRLGEPPCGNQPSLLVTIGCEREHMATAPACPPCLDRLRETSLLVCDQDWTPMQITDVRPLHQDPPHPELLP